MAIDTILSLPNEIHAKIISFLPDWTTLRALITASPLHLGIYGTAREEFLIQIVRNQLRRDVVLTMLWQVRLCLTGHPTREQESKAQAIVMTARVDSIDHISVNLARQILSVEAINDRFILDYERTQLRHIQHAVNNVTSRSISKSKTLECNNESDNMEISSEQRCFSYLERVRVQRAFRRLELLHWVYEAHPDSTWALSCTLKPHLEHIPPHELEEFLCICRYMMDEIDESIDLVEKDYKDRADIGDVIVHYDPPRVTTWIDIPDVVSFSTADTRDEWIEHALMYGLDKLRDLIRPRDSESRIAAFEDTIHANHFLTADGLSHTQRSIETNVYSEGCDEIESQWGSNDAYKSLMLHAGEIHGFGVRDFLSSLNVAPMKEMRRLGYAFWDRERCRQLRDTRFWSSMMALANLAADSTGSVTDFNDHPERRGPMIE